MDIIRNPKFKQVMTKLLEPGFQITNEHLKRLLQHIRSPEKTSKMSGDSSTVVISDDEDEDENEDLFIFSWLNQAFAMWEATGNISSNGLWFILNLMMYLSKNESTFIHLNMQTVLRRLLDLSPIGENPDYFDNQLNYCQLFSIFISHKSGLDWVLSNNATDKIASAATKSKNPEMFKECCDFIANVLDKSAENNELLCKNIIKSLVIAIFIHLPNIPTDDSEDINISEQVIIRLNLLTGILEKLLELCCKRNSFKTFKLFQENFSFIKYVKQLKSLSKIENIDLEADFLFILLIFFELCNSLKERLNINEKQQKIQKHFTELTNTAKELIKQQKFIQNFKLVHKAVVYLKWIKNLMPDNGTPFSLQFDIQILAFQTMPLLKCTHDNLNLNTENILANDDLRQIILHKMMQNFSELNMRLMLELQTQIKDVAINDGIVGITYILKSKKFYSREVVKYLIQGMVFLLADIIYAMENFPENCEHLIEEYLGGILVVIIEFVQEFNVSWPESIKFLSLTEMSYKFLNLQIASADLITKGLQLLNIAISRHLSPTLVLLVDDSEETLVNNIGSMLVEKLTHPAEEVRKNALDIIYTIASNSKTKFPSFRQTIQKNNFPNVVFTVAVNNTDSSVKTAALRCLQQMLQVDNIRKNILDIPHIDEQLTQMLYLEEDVFVRIEASDVITRIYDLDTMESRSDDFCNIMSQIIFEDKETNLKIKILDFWHKVIDVFFRRQGILDGQFPEATFSKHLKRIIHFDRQSIRSSLYSILSDLSQNGCLAIFRYIFREESDFDICIAAKDCFDDLITLLKKHNITSSSTSSSDYFSASLDSMSPLTDISENLISPALSPVSFLSDFESIDVEELGILDSSISPTADTRIFSTQDSTFSTNFVEKNNSVFKGRQIVTPKDFLKYIYSEFDTRFDELQLKVNIKNSVDNFLDQILSNTD